ncbi:isochorismatase family protein [Vibrio vulnificus]|uniref:isochorismatase family protein n=1 Tax=Vibrio vulnificus TaxID=672 RepID=UPI00092806C3|nr:isochorismatase family protein [Vibrio vulnificus]EGQ7699891.1 isochorismatase family protein [Vibrio vulnificus]EGQ7955580.1 isochorismatase family protein [Vibrio vulnificus]EGQ7987772.1 isochorismatase family protein [Vibrio vulnificus]EGQ9237515.1 isochorismatase family protein [Vibrio vulnificus]EGQ9329366.1 isochorismatase family protein [Vibrio vulnificus]
MGIPKIAGYPLPTPAEFPDNRTGWTIDPDQAVLLIHDMQEYFVNYYQPDSSPVVDIIQHIQRLKAAAKKAGIPVIYTAQPANQHPTDRALLTDFWGPGLNGDHVPIVEALSPEEDDIEYVKWRYSAFKKTPLLEFMRAQGKSQLIISGIYGHIGILSTTLDAFMLDIQPFVIGDAIADFTREDHLRTLQYVASRSGSVKRLDEALDEISSHKPLTLEQIQQDVATSLGIQPDEVDLDEDLMFVGLDSMRAMVLVEKWHQQGENISFGQLMEAASLREWWLVIEQARNEEQTMAVA